MMWTSDLDANKPLSPMPTKKKKRSGPGPTFGKLFQGFLQVTLYVDDVYVRDRNMNPHIRWKISLNILAICYNRLNGGLFVTFWHTT